MYLVASLITGAVVSISGPIAYIGLFARTWPDDVRQRQSHLVPGGLYVRRNLYAAGRHPGADRTFPHRLPVRIITAFCGRPAYLPAATEGRGT